MGNRWLSATEKLARVGRLVEGWSTGGADPLERDLALELLREVYSEIKFGTAAVPFTGEDTVALRYEPEPAEEAVTDPLPQKPEPEPQPEPEAAIEPETESTEIPEAEPVIVPRRVNPELIRSLYGGDAPVETLGDTLGSGRQTLGEVLRGGEKDVASQLAAAECSDLRSSIGLNDRFLMIRDMFDGDAGAFDAAIRRLDEFGDLDSAIIHIHETYHWSADSEGAARLVELLERKLG